MSSQLPVDRWVDEQKVGRFNLLLLFWSFLAMVSDGLDIAALASAAPALAVAWHVPAKAFGPAFTASLFGVLLGAPLLGYLGDRFGRRVAIIIGCTIYGLGTLACAWASNLDQMMVLRFLTGVGLGGLVPNTIALNSELAPKRLRATFIVLMFMGISTGSTLPGTIQAWLIPQYGWRIMFWIGGVAPLLIAACLMFALPESVKFLRSRPERRRELLATLRRMFPERKIPDDVELMDDQIAPVSGSGIAEVLRGRLAWITPLLWACFATALMANYFVLSWLPLMLATSGFSAEQNGIITSLYHYGGALGGLLVGLVLARFGYTAVALLFLVAIPAIAALGMSGLSYWTLTAVVTLAGFATLGAQLGNLATAGLLYPTSIRARGVGWALGIGRFVAMLGPLVGGMLNGKRLPLQQLMLLAAVPMVIGLIASLGVARVDFRNVARKTRAFQKL